MQMEIALEKVQLDLVKEAAGKKSITKTVTQDLWELSSGATLQENGWRHKIVFFKSKILDLSKDWITLKKG